MASKSVAGFSYGKLTDKYLRLVASPVVISNRVVTTGPREGWSEQAHTLGVECNYGIWYDYVRWEWINK